MSQRAFALDPIIKAPGQLPPAWAEQLVQCTVDDSVNLPAVAVLAFRDPDHDLLTDTGITIGTPLEVSVTTVKDNSQLPLFSGEIIGLETEYDETGTFTVLRAADRAHRLMRRRRVLAFRNMTAADIVRRVAAKAGLTVGKVRAPGATYQQISQANVTDWEFLQALAAEHGAVVRVDDQGRLDFTEPDPASKAPSPRSSARLNPLVLQYGENLLSLRAVLSTAEQVDSVTVRGWDVTTKRPVVARARAATSKTVLAGMSSGQSSHRFGGAGELLVTDGAYRTQAEVDTAAKAQATAASAGFGEVEAVCEGNPHLRAGVPVALANVGPSFSGRYTASASHHVFEPGNGYRTTVTVSGGEDRSVAGLAAPAAPEPPRIPGLAIGVVTDVKETPARGRGWVKLRFPWLSDDYVTDWVRTVQLGGARGGGVFSPDVNDEVLVGFEQGLLDKPYVLGGLYNGVDLPSPHDVPLVDPTSGRVNRRSFATRSGDRVELLDARGGPRGVRLRSGDGKLEVNLDRQGTSVIVHSDGTVQIEAARNVQITGRGVVVDAGAGDLALRGRTVSVSGRAGVSIDGGTSASVRAAIVRIN
ncbi:VgrG-related protein [Amycolatopsis anabasis]|uniref:VgrG-related protein n=1 Tax=Amycolatopsis anabasis TaxID=1840409 RepID=UPI00131ACCA6|nr:VgrG-related protein [Amycolatopsis anabasis]